MVKLKVYSKAFFEIALEKNKVDAYMSQAQVIIDALNENAQFTKLLVHPDVSETKKIKLLTDVFENRVDEDFIGLFHTVVLKRREIFLVSILEGFVALCLDHKNMTVAKVITPVLLDKMQEQKIKAKLNTMLGKEILLDVIVKPELVSGFKIIADGAIIDTSFKKQMEDMRVAMYKNLASKEAVHGS